MQRYTDEGAVCKCGQYVYICGGCSTPVIIDWYECFVLALIIFIAVSVTVVGFWCVGIEERNTINPDHVRTQILERHNPPTQ